LAIAGASSVGETQGREEAKVPGDAGSRREPMMKRLYQTILDNEARVLGVPPPAARPLATVEQLEAYERKLGVVLPRTYKSFASQIGSAAWPVAIRAADALAPYAASAGRPAHLMPFASDGGNDWCFDTRAIDKGERAIVRWDREAPPTAASLASPAAPTSFDDWLKELVAAQLSDDVTDALADRHARLIAALVAGRPEPAWPDRPTAAEVTKAEGALRFTLPKDYVWLTTTVGALTWPLEIVSAREVGRLTEEMKRQFPAVRGAVAVGREADGSFVAYMKHGKLAAVGGRPIEDVTLLDFLERRIAQRSGAEKAAASHDAQVPWRIVEDERINAVWRVVAESKRFSVVNEPDGRIQVVVEDFMTGKRRMFLEPAAWAVVAEHLAARKRG
jgi:hypothetical protein